MKSTLLSFLSLIFILSYLHASNGEMISKKYYVKGMTCGGCIISAKIALNKSDKLRIKEKKISVGEAVLTFHQSDYKQRETDCNITKAVEQYTEFQVFLDKNYIQRACI